MTRRGSRWSHAGWAAACAVLLMAWPVLGQDGEFELVELPDWEDALLIGNVVPMSPVEWDPYWQGWQSPIEGEPYPPTMFLPPELYVYPGGLPPFPEGEGLVMAWGEEGLPEDNYSSGWQYTYETDKGTRAPQDLTGATIKGRIFAPTGINIVSIGVATSPTAFRSWTWNVAPGNTIQHNTWYSFTIDLSKTGTAAASPRADNYTSTPGFTLTSVTSLYFDETFHPQPGLVTLPPPGGSLNAFWNAWRNIKVVRQDARKWSQPPDQTSPENVFYGWNEYSEWWNGPVAADDWVCDTDDPVTDVHWWGSFLGWKDPYAPPQGMGMPTHFHILMWTDVPANDPNNMLGYSHPGRVVHEIFCYNYTYEFVGWDFDPFTRTYEACFKFEQDLLPEEWFYQDPGPEPTIYWLSIAACYEGVDPPPEFYPFGWKTRPRSPDSPAPDAAVRIWDPIQPGLAAGHNLFYFGDMIVGPEGSGYDLAFELTSKRTKFEQPPDPTLPGLHAHDWSFNPGALSYIVLADDWLCEGGDVLDLHWYGNYELDEFGIEKRGSGIYDFHLSIHACTPGPQGFCVPMDPPLWSMNVPFANLTEQPTGMINIEGCQIYEYGYDLPQPFMQEAGQYYWLDVSVNSNDPMNPAIWRWQEANRSPQYLVHAPAAEKSDSIPMWQSIIWDATQPIRYTDLAFDVTSGDFVKWSQPPQEYYPEDAYNGWDEYSVFASWQIAADDWYCDTDAPVTDVHWWGSFLGWYEPVVPNMLPDAFHFAIWTDVPANPDDPNSFSHPGVVVWEHVCDNYTFEFVGWDFDPRDVDGLYMPPEATFLFQQDLDPNDWFYQDPNENNIYWLSIAAMYGATQPEYPFGWKTLPRDPRSPAPDDAVVITTPTAPLVGMWYEHGWPIYYPTRLESWDLAFELTTREPPVGCPGDCDCDGDRDYFDINYFLMAIQGEQQWIDYYKAQHGGTPPPCSYLANCDVDGSGMVDYFDINPFIAVLGIPCP